MEQVQQQPQIHQQKIQQHIPQQSQQQQQKIQQAYKIKAFVLEVAITRNKIRGSWSPVIIWYMKFNDLEGEWGWRRLMGQPTSSWLVIIKAKREIVVDQSV